MTIDREYRDELVRELQTDLNARFDGGRKNLIVPVCPFCGKEGGKFGIYIGPETKTRTPFMSHCFSCGRSTRTLEQLLDLVGRPDLKPVDTTPLGPIEPFFTIEEDEIDDSLVEVDMPEGWKRCFRNPYLLKRGFTMDDYELFPVGTTRGLNFRFDDYVVFPIYDEGAVVGYISRHIWSKDDIDEYNNRAKRNGRYQIRRYNNSTENDFVKLLYNYDMVYEDETDTVIIVEGVFDVIALTRKLKLYDNRRCAVVATFGKKISDVQIYKLQSKGVRDVVIGYDADAYAAVLKAADRLSEYFRVHIAWPTNGKDWDEMDRWDVYEVFAYELKTPTEFKLQINEEY